VSLPRYPEYKDSGVEWLGEVPVHWDVLQLKRMFHIVGGSTPKADIEFWDDQILWATPADLSKRESVYISDTERRISVAGLESCAASLVPKNSIIISTRAPIGSLAIADREMCTNQGCKSLVPYKDTCPEYFAYLLSISTAELNIRGKGTTFLELSSDALGAFVTPAPPLDEQTHVAAFLDRETARIDALAAEQQRLIELLKEKRQAVISHAVTKGLNPDAPMKNSGIEWLGEIPAHWQITPLKWLTDPQRPIMYGIVLPGPDVGDGVPILKGGNVRPSRMNLEAMARTTPEIEAPYARARLRAGDLVYSIRGSIGDCEPVPSELEGANITQDVARVAVARENSASWVRWALLAPAVREELASGSLGAAVRGVNIFDLKRAKLPTPPAREQASIAAFLDHEITKIHALTAEAQLAIDLLHERRSALISAAVTGQIDVRPRAQKT